MLFGPSTIPSSWVHLTGEDEDVQRFLINRYAGERPRLNQRGKVDMPQKEIELILARQLASYLVTPIFIVDPEGTILFYNEPAERILGHRFEETGEMPITQWSAMLSTPLDAEGVPLAPEAMPLVVALGEHRPTHSSFWIRDHENRSRCIEVTAFPIIGQAGRSLGAIAIFWEGNSCE